jgi:RecA-family ATPase
MVDPVNAPGTSGSGAPRLQLWNMGEDHDLPPPRAWLMKGTFCKGFLSGIAAAGGVGKTALRIVQLLAVATGRVDLTGDHVFGRFRVLFISLEDDLAEIRRRIWAATQHHGIPHDELLDCFWVTNPSELKLARISSTNPRRIEPGELAAELRRVILDRRIDIVAIDPFLKTHEADENDNGMIDQVCVLLVRIAIECGCAVDIVHHTAKGFTRPGDADRMRGASALRDAVRLFYTVTGMSEKEANGFGVSAAERRSLMRLDSAKLNLLPPAPEAKWFRFVDIELGNRTNEYPAGDRVQTCELWHRPDRGAGIPQDALKRIFDQLEAGPTAGRRYSRASNTAEEREAWRLLQTHCPNLTRFQANDELKRWLKAGFIVESQYKDPVTRKLRSGLFVVSRPM